MDALTGHVRSFARPGVVEGHVNRIKMLKRQMFGRARFRPVRTRVLLA
ncbi:hypothetical protein ACIA8E_39650 [Streptomyces sp. NPDC051664]